MFSYGEHKPQGMVVLYAENIHIYQLALSRVAIVNHSLWGMITRHAIFCNFNSLTRLDS